MLIVGAQYLSWVRPRSTVEDRGLTQQGLLERQLGPGAGLKRDLDNVIGSNRNGKSLQYQVYTFHPFLRIGN